MKTRQDILKEARRISAEIAQIKIDAEHWNNACRKPDEAEIAWDPEGEMFRAAGPLDELIAKEEGWHVYQLNDCDCWLARNAEEAKADATIYYGGGEFAADMFDERFHRLSQIELHTRMFTVDDDKGSKITFRQELDNRMVAGAKLEMFASTEF